MWWWRGEECKQASIHMPCKLVLIKSFPKQKQQMGRYLRISFAYIISSSSSSSFSSSLDNRLINEFDMVEEGLLDGEKNANTDYLLPIAFLATMIETRNYFVEYFIIAFYLSSQASMHHWDMIWYEPLWVSIFSYLVKDTFTIIT